jgi:hypothetical protein
MISRLNVIGRVGAQSDVPLLPSPVSRIMLSKETVNMQNISLRLKPRKV